MNQEDTPRTVVMNIDAALAIGLLALNHSHEAGTAGTNRPLRRAAVEKYARDMLAGNWKSSHQGIGLVGEAPNEVLIDGQHRLHAVLLASRTDPTISIPMLVTKGLHPSVVSAIDTNLRRMGADALAMERGVRNPNVIAAALRLVHLYDEVPWSLHAWTSFKPSHAQLLEFFDQYPGVVEASQEVGTAGRVIPPSPLTAATFLTRRERPEIGIKHFLHALRTGADIGERSPILALRNYGQNAIKNGVRREPPAMLALTIRAVNAWIIDDRRTNMRWEPSQPFPRITDRRWVSR